MNKLIINKEGGKNGKLRFEFYFDGKLRMMIREENETIARTVQRFQSTLDKLIKKRNKKPRIGAEASEPADPVLLDINNEIISDKAAGSPAWKRASKLTLRNEEYKVMFNYPKVSLLKFPGEQFESFPIVPLILFDHGCLQYSKVHWYRSTVKSEDNNVSQMECDETEHNGNQLENWVQVSSETVYTPTKDDVGHVLKVKVYAGNEERPATDESHCKTAESKFAVSVIDEPCLYESIPGVNYFCKNKKGIRVVSYNILADCYTTMNETSKTEIFPYVNPEAIKIKYRLNLIIKELIAYNGDIIALQEADRYIFEEYLVPTMSVLGYGALFGNKKSSKEGVSIFYRKSAFNLLKANNIIFSEAVKGNKAVLGIIYNSNNFYQRVLRLGSCGLMCVLEDLKNNSMLLVVNTHLYFHPRGSHVRLAQTQILLTEMEGVVEEMRKEYPGRTISYLFCADMNSYPSSGAIELIKSGKLAGNHTDWYSSGISEHPGVDAPLSHGLNFKHAIESRRYTNYAASFYAHIDHSFVSADTLTVTQVLGEPDHEKVTKYTAIPSKIAPSDHVAQVFDIEYL